MLAAVRALGGGPAGHPDGEGALRPAARRLRAGLAAARLLLPRARRGAPAYAGRRLTVLRTDGDAGRDGPDVAYALRWRAVRPGRLRRAGRPGAPRPDRAGRPGPARRRRCSAPASCRATVSSSPSSSPGTSPTCRCRRTPPCSRTRRRARRWCSTPTRPEQRGLAADGGPAVAAPAGRGAGPLPRPGVRADRRRAPLHPAGRHVRRQRVRGGGRPARRVPGAGDDPGGPLPGGRGGPPAPVRPVAGGAVPGAAGGGRLAAAAAALPGPGHAWSTPARSATNAASTRPGRRAPR